MSVTSLELDYQIKEFDLFRKRESKKFQEKKELQEKFARDFPLKKINQLKLDEYIQGKGSKKSFCYRLETGLVKLGNMKGATSNKFGVYYGKYGEDTESKYRFTEKFGSTKEEALRNVKLSIVELLKAGKNSNREEIISSKLAPLFRYKLLATYYPEKYLNIYAKEHLDFFLAELGVNTLSEKMYDKHIALMKYKNRNNIMSKWSNNEFNSFLYRTFGKPPTNEKEKAILEAFPPIERVNAEIIDFKILTKNNSKKTHKGKNKYKPDYKNQNDRNNRLGARGENIVYNLEKRFFKKYNFNINKLIRVSEYDDSLGYDIQSLDEKGNKKYIEVKSTRSNSDIVNFIISSNEKEEAKNLNNYYIYVVLEAHTLHPKIIQIKDPINSYEKKMNFTPINYRVVFNIKRT